MSKNFDRNTIEICSKGFPLDSYGKAIDKFLRTKPNIFSSRFQFPIMVLKETALKQNIDRMARFCKSVGAELAPHVKTTMSPQIAQMQVSAGAYALTIANFWQSEIFRNYGFKKLIVANEILDPVAIEAISTLNAKNKAEIIFYVDSLADLAKNYLEGTDAGITAILRPTYPDSTSPKNLINKVSTLVDLGISNIDFYLLDTMRASDLESIKHSINK